MAFTLEHLEREGYQGCPPSRFFLDVYNLSYERKRKTPKIYGQESSRFDPKLFRVNCKRKTKRCKNVKRTYNKRAYVTFDDDTETDSENDNITNSVDEMKEEGYIDAWKEKFVFFQNMGVFEKSDQKGRFVQEFFDLMAQMKWTTYPYSVFWDVREKYFVLMWENFLVYLNQDGTTKISFGRPRELKQFKNIHELGLFFITDTQHLLNKF